MVVFGFFLYGIFPYKKKTKNVDFSSVLSVSEFDFSKEKNITTLSHLEPQENVEQMYADTTNKML